MLFTSIIFPQFRFPCCMHGFFSLYYVSVSKPKSDLSGKIFTENQLAIKPIKTRIRNTLSSKMLTFKIWSVCFSFMLGYIRFQQPHDNKKLRFSLTLTDKLKIGCLKSRGWYLYKYPAIDTFWTSLKFSL